MLQKLRSSVSGIFGIGLILLLVVAFAVWGIADSFTTLSNNVIARVGNVNIEAQEFSLRYAQQIQALSRELEQPVTREQARALGLDQQVLGTMIGMAALNNATQDMGLAMSDDRIAQAIIADPAFRGANGQFDEAMFRFVLRQNGLTEKLFTSDQRNFALRGQLLQATSEKAHVPEALLSRMYNYILEQRIVRYTIISPASIDEVGEPSEEELVDFYNGAKLRFADPERRSSTLLMISAERFAETIIVTDEDIEEEYAYREAEFTAPEKREIDQLVLTDDESIEIARRLRAENTPFAEIVAAVDQSLDNTDLGLVTRDEMISADLADAAFALDKGGMSEVIEGPLGSVIMRVRKIEPGTTTPLADVRDQLSNDVRNRRAADEIIVFSERIIDEVAAGEMLEDIAQKYDLELLSLNDIDRNGTLPDGSTPNLLKDIDGLVGQIFESQPGDEPPMHETAMGGVYWLRVDTITESQSRPLADVREQAIEQWQKNERKTLLESMAQHLVDEGNTSNSFQSIEESLDQKSFTSEPISRQLRSETFSAEGVEALFNAEQDQFIWAPVGFGPSLIVMQVTQIISPDTKNNVAMSKIFTTETERYRMEMTNQFVGALRDSMGTSVDNAALRRALQAN